MLKFGTKRLLMDMITDALIEHRDEFREKLMSHLTKQDSINKADTEKIFEEINNYYYSAVTHDVICKVNDLSPEISERLEEVSLHPSLSGCNDNNPVNEMTADKLFAFCFYAMTGKKASKRNCVASKQLQNFAMQDVLRQAYSESNIEAQ